MSRKKASSRRVDAKIAFPRIVMLLIILSFTLLVETCQAQPEDEIHRLLICYGDDASCGLGYFCNFESGEAFDGVCVPCPAPSLAEEKCRGGDLNNIAVQHCLDMCVVGQDGDRCAANATCAHDAGLFCNYANGDGTGTCERCKSDASECLAEDLGLSEIGMESCIVSCDLNCDAIAHSEVAVDGDGIYSYDINGSPSLTASGPLVDCTNLIYDSETTCPGVNNSVCLVEDITKRTLYYEVVWKCEQSGGVAVVLFGNYEDTDSADPSWGYLSYKETKIPSVFISFNDGKQLMEHKIGSQALVSVKDKVGDYCWKEQKCSETTPCIGSWSEGYCAFDWIDEGWCWKCPVHSDGSLDPYACFFDRSGGFVFNQNAVESCASSCGASLTFDSCKFCPSDVTAFAFGVERESDRCHFCEMDDVKYPQREVSVFGEGTKCWQMQAFFESVEVHIDSQNCQLARMMNYICGCEGPGYGGASTETKKRLLAWLPRIMAILSLMGSSFIVFDASRTRERREKVHNQLLIVLSVFDMLGSCAYAFTSLPVPADDYIFGSIGNEASCTTQGFFIQLGTISCYTNVSISVYYLLVISLGWNDSKVKKVRLWLFLLPLLVGLSFAFAGIPFYDNMVLWCNNGASWWPDIAVAIAIAVATVIMVTVCWHVFQKERASARWRGGAAASGTRADRTVSNMVFWQAFWYLMAFYLTWPPYLALQYSWASGKSYSSYGLILFAGTMVPLQGLWNFFVYVRPRYAKGAGKKLRQSLSSQIRRLGLTRRSTTAVSSVRESSHCNTTYTTGETPKRNFDDEETVGACLLPTIQDKNPDERIKRALSNEEVVDGTLPGEETEESKSVGEAVVRDSGSGGEDAADASRLTPALEMNPDDGIDSTPSNEDVVLDMIDDEEVAEGKPEGEEKK